MDSILSALATAVWLVLEFAKSGKTNGHSSGATHYGAIQIRDTTTDDGSAATDTEKARQQTFTLINNDRIDDVPVTEIETIETHVDDEPATGNGSASQCGTDVAANPVEEETLSDNETYLVPPPLSLFFLLIHQLCKHMKQNTESDKSKKSLLSGTNKEEDRQNKPLVNKNLCTRIWKVLANGISLFVFLGFSSYLTQAIPSISISYYLSPTASLIRLGFFELVVIVLIMEGAYLLFLLEKWTWLAYVHYNNTIPEEIQEETSTETKQEKIMNRSKYIKQYIVYDRNSKESKLVLLPLSKNRYSFSCKAFHWLLLVTLFQIMAFIFVIYVSWRLLNFLLTVIIDQTTYPNDDFKNILAILPTIALNIWLILKQGNVLYALKDIVSKANKTTLEQDSHAQHVNTIHSLGDTT